MNIPAQTKDWLMQSDILHVRYNAARLFNPAAADRKTLLADPFVRQNMALLKHWDTEILSRHDKADLLLHRLALLADLGVQAADRGMAGIIQMILKQTETAGIPLISIAIPKAFGGDDQPHRAWMLCDFPTVLYSLLTMGAGNVVTSRALEKLTALVDENGYRCLSSLPKMRGPGSKGDICPYANLITAKALSIDPQTRQSAAAEKAVSALLHHWQVRKEKKYYLFGIGTDFRKLKFPLVWYNLLHMLEVVSRYPKFHNTPAVREMAALLLDKADEELRFRPESMYRCYKEQDFADKKQPSPTVTLAAMRILQRLGMVN